MVDVEQTPAGDPKDDKGSILSDSCPTEPVLQTDKHGLPLVPQPSVWKDDPLVYIYEPFSLDALTISHGG
jgi:hypothetical protein